MNKQEYDPPQKLSLNAKFKSLEDYLDEYTFSVNDSDNFWSKKAERIDWYEKWDKISDVDFTKPQIRWFINGKLNVSYNCLDRHIENGHGDSIAFFWEGNDNSETKSYTYNELLVEVNKFSNVLKNLNVSKGDRVCLYTVSYTHLTLPTILLV